MDEKSKKILDDISVTKETAISLLRIKLGLIPAIGPILNEFFFDLPSRVKQNRLNDFIDELSQRLAETEETQIKKDFFSGDEFYDLITQVFESAVRTSAKEKHRALAQINQNSFRKSSKLLPDRASLFAKFIGELHPIQIRILKFIKEWNQQVYEVVTYEAFHSRFEGCCFLKFDKYEFKYFSGDLERKSLISMGCWA